MSGSSFTLNPSAYFDYGVTERSAPPPDGTRNLWFGSEPEDYTTDVLAERAVDFIRSSGPEPFFLYFSPKAPHIGGPMKYALRRHATLAAWTGWSRGGRQV